MNIAHITLNVCTHYLVNIEKHYILAVTHKGTVYIWP